MKRLLFTIILIAAGLAPAARAAQAVMDFNTITTGGGTSPYTEDGIRLDTMFENYSPYNFEVGNPSIALRTGFGFGVARYRLSLANGKSFSMISIRVAPVVGVASSTTFTGRKADTSTVTQTFSHGTNNNGTVRTFPASFQDIVALEWSTTSALSTQGFFDDFTVELPSEIRMPSTVTVTEGAGTVNLGVTFEPALARPISFTWQALAGTASHPADYSFGGSTTATVTIPAGAADWSIPCTIVSDTTSEALETFTLVYNTTSLNAYLPASPITTVRIGNDDGVANFAGWMSGHGLVGNDALADADPNGDGVKNIEAWLFRLNPAGPSPAAWFDRRATFQIDSSTQRPGLRLQVPAPLPSDVRLIFEENAALSAAWSEQSRRGGFGIGALWTGTGSSRVTETNTSTARTITCGASLTTRQRARAFLRMKYELISGGGSN